MICLRETKDVSLIFDRKKRDIQECNDEEAATGNACGVSICIKGGEADTIKDVKLIPLIINKALLKLIVHTYRFFAVVIAYFILFFE